MGHTPTMTDLPLWARLLTILHIRARAEGTDTLQLAHRPLAAQLRCSPAMLPRLMRELEARRAIERIPFKNTFLIVVAPLPSAVIDHPADSDRSLPTTGDRSPDASDRTSQTEVIDQTRQKSPDRSRARQTGDRQELRRKQPMESKIQDQHACMQQASESRKKSDERGNERPPEIAVSTWQEIGHENPGYTPADFARDVQTVIDRSGLPRINAVRIVIAARRNGDPIYATPFSSARSQETRHGSPARNRTDPSRTYRADPCGPGGSGRSAQPDADDDFPDRPYTAAELAELGFRPPPVSVQWQWSAPRAE